MTTEAYTHYGAKPKQQTCTILEKKTNPQQ